MFIEKFERMKEFDPGWGRTLCILEHFYKYTTSLRSKGYEFLVNPKMFTLSADPN